MIEIWRQCVTAVGTSPVGAGHEYMSVGALRAGGELREVRLLITASGTALSEFYLALSAVEAANATSFGVATPMMQGPGAYRHLGAVGWAQSLYVYFPGMPIFPFAVQVESGSRWVHVAWLRSDTRVICVAVTVTVIGFAPVHPVERDVVARDKR